MSTQFQVRYFNPEKSRKGQGVQVMNFNDRADAEEFAKRHQVYARPCRVEPADVFPERHPELRSLAEAQINSCSVCDAVIIGDPTVEQTICDDCAELEHLEASMSEAERLGERY